MLLSFLSILAFALAARAFMFCLRHAWNWLGRGREIEDAVDRRKIDPSVIGDVKRGHVHLSREEMRILRGMRREDRRAYVEQAHIGWYQSVILFIGGSIVGLVCEQIWMWLSVGSTDSRVGLVWGPFSPLYGFGTVIIFKIVLAIKKHGARPWQVFLACALTGSILEQLTGWGMETFFNAQSWTYIYLPDHITQWVCWRSVLLWGLLGLGFAEFAMPEIIYRIGDPTTRRQVVFVGIMTAYLALDMFMTVACFHRRAERNLGLPPSNVLETWVDEHYTDQFMAARFQNMVVGEDL